MLELPEWLLALAYAAIGWSVGLKFNKADLPAGPENAAADYRLHYRSDCGLCAAGAGGDPGAAARFYDRLSGDKAPAGWITCDYCRRYAGRICRLLWR